MFNLQGSEIIIVLLLALVVLGPEKLPDAMRKMGQFYGELKKMSAGFQSEFRAAVDEPMRELRDTANTLRDSADFTKLQDGERAEKPKSGEMATVGDPVAEPVDDVPTFDRDGGADDPAPAPDSKPAPFSGRSSAAPRPSPTAPDSPASPDEASSTDDEPDPAGDVAAPDRDETGLAATERDATAHDAIDRSDPDAADAERASSEDPAAR